VIPGETLTEPSDPLVFSDIPGDDNFLATFSEARQHIGPVTVAPLAVADKLSKNVSLYALALFHLNPGATGCTTSAYNGVAFHADDCNDATRPVLANAWSDTASNLSASKDELIGQILQTEEIKLKNGELQFDPPGKMRVNEDQGIEAIVSRTLRQRIESALDRPMKKGTLKISNDMSAALVADSDDFKITTIDDSQKTFAPDGTIHWEWHVSPKRPGPKKEMDLIVSAFLLDPMENGVYHRFDALRSVFQIQVQTLTPFEQVLTFTKNNWQWLFGLIPLSFLPSFANKIWKMLERKPSQMYDDMVR
jgi:hypothetical protein